MENLKKHGVFITILVTIVLVILCIIHNSYVVTQRKAKKLQISPKTVSLTSNVPVDNNSVLNQHSPLVPEFRLNSERTNNQNIPERSLETVLSVSNEYSSPNDEKKFYAPPNRGDIDKNNSKILNPIPVVRRPKSFTSSLSMCEPYKETLTTEYMGMNIKYDLEILGWINNKCVLNFVSNMLGSGEGFEDLYGISADSSQIVGFAPKIRCEFTKQQLLYVGDNILEENDKNRKMLKNPNQIEFPDIGEMSFSDVKLLQIIFNDNACKLVNSDEFNKLLNGLFTY